MALWHLGKRGSLVVSPFTMTQNFNSELPDQSQGCLLRALFVLQKSLVQYYGIPGDMSRRAIMTDAPEEGVEKTNSVVLVLH